MTHRGVLVFNINILLSCPRFEEFFPKLLPRLQQITEKSESAAKHLAVAVVDMLAFLSHDPVLVSKGLLRLGLRWAWLPEARELVRGIARAHPDYVHAFVPYCHS